MVPFHLYRVYSFLFRRYAAWPRFYSHQACK
jgi:hypothetical protein